MKKLLCIVATLALVVCGANTAKAAFMLGIDVGADAANPSAFEVLVIDNQSDGVTVNGLTSTDADGSGVTGRISYSNIIGGWDVAVSTTESKDQVGSTTSPLITLTFNVDKTTSGQGTLRIVATDTDFNNVAGLDGDVISGGGLVHVAAPEIRLFGGFDDGNDEFVMTYPKPDTGLVEFPKGAWELIKQDGVDDNIVNDNAFSMTLGLDLRFDEDEHASGNVENEMIPEPATCVIWSLLGLLGVAFARWRRRRKAA